MRNEEALPAGRADLERAFDRDAEAAGLRHDDTS
jgi:hypothetical protein